MTKHAEISRIIVNSRYCRVARSGEQTDGKNIVSGFAMENLVQYVGTREGVVFNQANGLNLPVTEKQTSFIQKLLDNCPDITNLIEYADYQEASTRVSPQKECSNAARREQKRRTRLIWLSGKYQPAGSRKKN